MKRPNSFKPETRLEAHCKIGPEIKTPFKKVQIYRKEVEKNYNTDKKQRKKTTKAREKKNLNSRRDPENRESFGDISSRPEGTSKFSEPRSG